MPGYQAYAIVNYAAQRVHALLHQPALPSLLAWLDDTQLQMEDEIPNVKREQNCFP